MRMTSERKNNRGKIQIMGDVLDLATSGTKKTSLIYRANLSYSRYTSTSDSSLQRGSITQDMSPDDGVVYRTTEKGREFLLYYTRLVDILEETEGQPKLELTTPYIGRSWTG